MFLAMERKKLRSNKFSFNLCNPSPCVESIEVLTTLETIIIIPPYSKFLVGDPNRKTSWKKDI